MSHLMTMNDVEFQPLELILREKPPEPIVWKYKKTNNYQSIQDTVKLVTQDHFSKLYEYIYLHSKPLTKEISKITKDHYLTISKKLDKGPDSPKKRFTTPHPPRLRVLAPSKGRNRLNQSYVEKSVKESSTRPYQTPQKPSGIPFLRNASIDVMSQGTISDKRGGSVELLSVQQLGGEKKSTTDVDGKLKLPKVITTNENSIGDITEKPSAATQKRKSEFQVLIQRESATPSREPSPRGLPKPKGGPTFVTDVLSNPAFREKYKERANRIRAEEIVNMSSPEFTRLLKLMTNDDKTQMMQLTKITKEQLRNHLLKRYPANLADRFLQVMDFPSSFDAKTYLEAFKSLLTDGMDISLFLCFKLFDLNDDGIINHRDIFTMLKSMDEYPVFHTDFNKLLHRPQKKGMNRFAQIAAKNMLRNTAQMSMDTTTSQDKQSYQVNRNTLALKINLLKTLESMISKQGEQRIMNLTQLRMVHQAELKEFLNYKRGKHKYTCWADMLGVLAISGAKKSLESNSKVSLQIPSNIMDKTNDFLTPVKAAADLLNIETISEWGEAGLDMVKFAEVFKDDMPFLMYDIFFHCTVMDASSKRYQFVADDVFNLYNPKPSHENTLNGSMMNTRRNSKHMRAKDIIAEIEAEAGLRARDSDSTEEM